MKPDHQPTPWVQVCRYLFLALILTACESGPAQEQTTTVPNQVSIQDSLLIELPYALMTPNQQDFLPSSLAEVSGATYLESGHVALVQDELGKVFWYDLAQQAVTHSHTFALPGDFEGIEWTGDKLFALRSDGLIFDIDTSATPKARILRTQLTEDDDMEGLSYRSDTKQLLLVGKEPARHKRRNDRYRAIYTYDLRDEALLPTPLTLDLAEIQAVYRIQANTPKAKERAQEFDFMKEKSFKPSAIAVHPISGFYYLLASSGKLLVVCDNRGRIRATHYLPRKVFSQPEGICFSPDGELFITNEGRDDEATLLRFSYQPHD